MSDTASVPGEDGGGLRRFSSEQASVQLEDRGLAPSFQLYPVLLYLLFTLRNYVEMNYYNFGGCLPSSA